MTQHLRFPDIFWIDASSEKSVEFVLTQISSTYRTTPDGRPSARSALDWISQRPNFLMVYDGADGHYSVVENFLPPGNGGNVMMTSRNIGLKRLASSNNSMEIHGMEDKDAISLLLKSAMLDDIDDDIDNLAQQLVLQLDRIPLAIDQAGAYMHSCGCSIDGYVELYTRYKNKLMREPGFKGASDYGVSTYGTWDISIKKMEDKAAEDNSEESLGAQSAIKLLRIFAFLDHANIPQELFKSAAENYTKRHSEEDVYLPSSLSLLDDATVFLGEHGEWDKMKFLCGIQVLLSFSFVRCHNHLYSMHLLVNSWSRSCIPKTEVTDHYYRARALLSCSITLDWDADNFNEFCQSLAPHIRSNMLHGLELKLNSKYYDDEYIRFGLVFNCTGSWNEEEQFLHVAVHQRKTRLGLDHLHTVTGVAKLASAYLNQGRWDEAEKHFMDVMSAFKTKLGSDHKDTLMIMGNLAETYRNQGRWDEAEKIQMDVINGFKTKLGSDHSYTLTSMSNLAATNVDQGKWYEAEKLFMDVMNAEKMKFGSDNLQTLNSMSNLASTYGKMG